jgi:hypothetical protein
MPRNRTFQNLWLYDPMEAAPGTSRKNNVDNTNVNMYIYMHICMNKYWIDICLCKCTFINTHETMVWCIVTPVPLHCCTTIQICSTYHQSNEKTSSTYPKMFDLECSWHLCGLIFFRFSTFCLSVCPSLHLSSTYLSIFPYASIYSSTVSPSDSIWLYITLCDSLGSISLSPKSSYLYYL